MKTYIHILRPLILAVLLAGGFTACQQDNDIRRSQLEAPSHNTKQDFEIVSVKSSGNGTSLELDLNLSIADLEAKSLQYDEDEETGALQAPIPEGVETALLTLRKQGDPNSTTYAEVKWQGRGRAKTIKLEKISIPLAGGARALSGDTWLITGILGGSQIQLQEGQVRVGSTNGEHSLGKQGTAEALYSFPWTTLRISAEGKGTLTAQDNIRFTPLGTLLRLHFFSNLLDTYDAQSLKVESNAWRSSGVLSAPKGTDAEILGKHPIWTPDLAEGSNASPEVKVYSFAPQGSTTGQSLRIAGGSGYEHTRTVYLWVMPTEQAPSATETKLTLKASPLDAPSGLSYDLTTYHKQGHRPLSKGHTYRLSNVLTSDLLISEIYYQYSPSTMAGNDANHNYSIVELYNPTASDIDLSEYALVRTVFYTRGLNNIPSNTYAYFAGKEKASTDLAQASQLALKALDGSGQWGKFSAKGITYTHSENAPRYRSIYGTASTILKPGRTILIGAGGYVSTEHKPSANIELFNTALTSGQISESNIANQYRELRALEQKHLPRAGMQADSAVQAGYAQYMVAIDNYAGGNTPTHYRDDSPNFMQGATGHGNRSGVLQLGLGQGLALIKIDKEKQSHEIAYKIVDITTPIGNAQESSTYRSKLQADLQSATGETPPATLSELAITSHSIVRQAEVRLPSSEYRAEEWVVTASENDGIKSLGTRSYVAGLTPFVRRYQGYAQQNNPQGLPFWAGKRFIAPSHKQWDKLPIVGENTFNSIGKAPVEGYELVPIASATATEDQRGYEIEKSFDGNEATYYNSKNFAQNPNFPITLTYNLSSPRRISYIDYLPHQRGTGHIQRVNITFTYEDNTSEVVYRNTTDTPISQQLTWAGIDNKAVKSVRFEVISGNNGVLAVREMKFFSLPEGGFDYRELFADALCTELKPGLTLEQIKACKDDFYRTIAHRMYQGIYAREFRIADYKAYPQPNLQQQVNKIAFPFSLLDNPTGIVAKAGEELIILVGDIPMGISLSLAINDQTKGQVNIRAELEQHTLVKGLNKIRPKSSGLIYLMYHTPTLNIDRNVYPNVRVHFVEGSGLVNGYFDSQNPKHAGRWQELLGKAQDTHFDVVGRYAHLAFPTNVFRKNTPDGLALINLYDLVVEEQMAIQGFFKYNRVMQNRMLYKTFYGTGYYLYAINNYSGIDPSAINQMASAQYITKNGWGLAHETGHMLQTAGFKWLGMNEITNNVLSHYTIRSVLGQETRLEKDDNYTRAYTILFQGNKTFSAYANENTPSFTNFVQLELYFGSVLGRTPRQQADRGGFYPDLYELLRQYDYSGVSHGKMQALFALHASRAAKMDLTSFFERWGFFRTADNQAVRDIYRLRGYITLTQAEVDEVKQSIKALGYPRPSVAIEYITARNLDLYRNPQPLVKGTASMLTDSTYTFSGWRNVVAWELVDTANSDEVICTAEARAGASHPLLIPHKLVDPNKLASIRSSRQWRAIAVDGTRTIVTGL